MDEIILVLPELLTFIICLHRMHQQKVKIDLAFVILAIYEVGLCYGITYLNFSLRLSISTYIAIYIYSLYKFKEKVLITLVEILLSALLVGIMQLFFYIPVSYVVDNPYKDTLIGVLVNILCLVFMVFLSIKIKFYKITEYINQKSILTYICFSILIFYFGIQIYSLKINYHWDGIHLTEVLIWLLLVLILWIQAQKNRIEKIKKEVLLQKQEQYVKSFEEQLERVRFKQHDMKNHLSALYGMIEETKNDNEKFTLQREYCDYLLNDKEYRHLIKGGNPVFTGFLNNKIQEMETKEIEFQYEFAYIELENNLNIYEWIEVVGILLDNAIEAVQNQSKEAKKIYMELNQDKSQIALKVANISRYIDSNESIVFFEKGYSTKGKGRGIGLAKVKELVIRKNGEIVVKNIRQDYQNWIEFMVCFKNRN